jgi:hypothetical protein
MGEQPHLLPAQQPGPNTAPQLGQPAGDVGQAPVEPLLELPPVEPLLELPPVEPPLELPLELPLPVHWFPLFVYPEKQSKSHCVPVHLR